LFVVFAAASAAAVFVGWRLDEVQSEE
jgi:hypothetical protein